MASEIVLRIDGKDYLMKYDNMERDHISVIDHERLAASLVNELEVDGVVDKASLVEAINGFLETIYEDVLFFAYEYADDNEMEIN